MKVSEAIAFLQVEGWFSALAPDLQADLVSKFRFQHLVAGEPLFHAGAEPGGLVGLASGCLIVEVSVGPRPPQPCFLLHPGTWIGEGTAVDLPKRMIGLRSTTPSTIAKISRKDLHETAEANPNLWRLLVGLAVENNARAVRMADALMERDIRRRLALVLLLLSGAYDEYAARPATIEMNQSTLAATANLSRSSASVILRDMQDSEILAVGRKSVRVLNLKKLNEIAEA